MDAAYKGVRARYEYLGGDHPYDGLSGKPFNHAPLRVWGNNYYVRRHAV